MTTNRRRFGIAEWYGRSFLKLSPKERRRLALFQISKDPQRKNIACPFRSSNLLRVPCTKEGGVCSIRLYEEVAGGATPLLEPMGEPRTLCPNRFQQENEVYRWVSEVVLGAKRSSVIGEIGFLERQKSDDYSDKKADNVGRIDNVLLIPGSEPLQWCALEVQAVYFSGKGMLGEFKHLAEFRGRKIPFPAITRRPDYRSSGPKRLMPQLQTKVPTLRRWGKKMAVVVDRSFFNALGKMEDVRDISNCDIAWFVVGFDESTDPITLVRESICFTTLERAVEGLTGGVPVTLDEFEKRIKEKAARLSSRPSPKPDLAQ
jgi:hypothetical protein